MSFEIEMSAQEMVDWANASLDRTRELEQRIERLEAQCEALQNKCARRGLSPEDSDALQAENERLRGALEYIANFAHPDFPAGDLEGELDRAAKIWLQFQNVAEFALTAAEKDDE